MVILKVSEKYKMNFITNIFYGFCHKIPAKYFYRTSPVGFFRSQQSTPHYNELRILRGKKHCQIKLQRFQKVWISTCGYLVHQINSLYEILKLNQIFQKKKVVTGKMLFFVIGAFWTPHSIFLKISFRHSSLVWEKAMSNKTPTLASSMNVGLSAVPVATGQYL